VKTISVGELRQNPTQMLREVESGETYVITRHGREVGRVVPPTPRLDVVFPAKHRLTTRLADRPRVALKTAASVDELIEDMKGDV